MSLYNRKKNIHGIELFYAYMLNIFIFSQQHSSKACNSVIQVVNIMTRVRRQYFNRHPSERGQPRAD